jgi:HD-like signal output (HDOD) protein
VEQSNIGCDFAEVGAELVRFWGMPSPIEQAIRHQLHPDEAIEYQMHASIVHLAGVAADAAQLETNRTVDPPPFDPFALSCTRFNLDEHQSLLTEAQQELQDTLAFISPLATAA